MYKEQLVSIVMPTYNRDYVLSEAIESIICQTYTLWELIIIDDGSSDNTKQTIDSFKDQRIRYFSYAENKGIGYARRLGVCKSRGDFIAFLDSDDLWLENKLHEQLQVFYQHPYVDFVFSDFINHSHILNTRERGFQQTSIAFAKMKTCKLNENLWQIVDGFEEALLTMNFIGTSTVIFRKKVVNQVGNFNASLSGPEDFEYWWRCAMHNTKFAYITKVLAERHKDEQSITALAANFAYRFLHVLDICEENVKATERIKLINQLNHARHQVLWSIIKAHAKQGSRSEAIKAFVQTFHYGISFFSFIYIFAALVGPVSIPIYRKLINLIASFNIYPTRR